MSQNQALISLPTIKNITVENYSLFTKTWSYDFSEGMNVFLGANGLGKTTTTYLIIYAISGLDQSLGIQMDYFKKKGSKIDELKDGPFVTVEYNIGDNYVSVTRYLNEKGIYSFTINNDTFSSKEIDNLDESYDGQILEEIGISDMEDLVFLLKKFIVREEEANYLLWDNEGYDQSRLIRLLINQPGFEHQFKNQEEKVRKLDSKKRDNQNFRKQFVKRLEVLQGERDRDIENNKEEKSLREIVDEKKITQKKIDSLIIKKASTLDDYNYLNNILNKKNDELVRLSLELEQKSESTRSIENQIFGDIYSDEKVLLAIHKLKHYNICLFCNTHTNQERSKSICERVEHDHRCPVCDNNLLPEERERTDQGLDDQYETLNKDSKEIRRLNEQFRQLDNSISKEREELRKLWYKQKEQNDQFHKLKTELNNLDLREINAQKSADERKETVYDQAISTLEKEIAKYDEVIDEADEELLKAKQKLEKIDSKQNKTIKGFQEKLNTLFKKYAHKYFTQDCELVLISRKSKMSQINVQSFVPSFNKTDRHYHRDCSTSERYFLEYIFRLSLMELYSTESGNHGFLMLETSEGAFDISTTANLAAFFIEYSKQKTPFTVITNFSKIDYLQNLVKGIQYNKERLLNYLEIGKLSKAQMESREIVKLFQNLNLK